MTRITRITVAALAALALATPVATAMPIGDAPYRDSERRANDSFVATLASPGASIRPQTGTLLPQGTATHTASACAPGTRAVHGSAGTGCTTSPRDNSDGFGAFALILTGAGAFAIALGARAGAGRGRGRASTAAA